MTHALLETVPRETSANLERFKELVLDENQRQNLISRTTEGDIWERHIIDSAQLANLGTEAGSWIDIGSGAGLPGIVIACLVDTPVTLVEPRRLRAEFLVRAANELTLDNVSVQNCQAEQVEGRFDTITARAVASVDRLLTLTTHLAHPETVWVLPKGRSAQTELANARRNWHCDAVEVASVTDREAWILVLKHVRAKAKP